MGNFHVGYWSSLQGVWLQVCIMASSAMAFLLFGYDQGVFGGLIATPQLLNGLGIGATDANLQGTIVSIYDIGCLTGCIGTAIFGMKVGRRVLIIIGCCLLILGAGLQGGAESVAMMIAGRVVAGFGTGINSCIIPVWVAECAQASRRGALVSLQISLVIVGLVIAYWFDYGMVKNQTGSVVWRLPLYFQMVFCVLTLATITLLPESPRYLYSKGYIDEADSIIARIFAVPLDHPTVKEHHREVMQALEVEHEVKFKISDIFFDRSPVNATWRIWICILIQFLQQLGGICLVSISYSERLRHRTTGSSFSPYSYRYKFLTLSRLRIMPPICSSTT